MLIFILQKYTQLMPGLFLLYLLNFVQVSEICCELFECRTMNYWAQFSSYCTVGISTIRPVNVGNYRISHSKLKLLDFG
jgi:hypothetical protein